MKYSSLQVVIILLLINTCLSNHVETPADFTDHVNQSPISLTSCQYKEFPDLIFEELYWKSNRHGFIFHNTGHSVAIHYPARPPSMLGGPLNGEYRLSEVHFHWGIGDNGSEHQIDNKFYAMEAHLVHYKKDYGDVSNAKNYKDGIAVVAVMLTASSDNSSTLSPIVNNLNKVRRPGEHNLTQSDSMIWLKDILEDPQEYFTYFGSLTTPFFDEVVTWIVMKNNTSIGRDQIKEFRELESQGEESEKMVENRRDLQKLNERTVWCSIAVLNNSNIILVLAASILVTLLSPTTIKY